MILLSPALISTRLGIKDYTGRSPKVGSRVETHPWEILATWLLGMLYSLPETSDSTVHQSPSLQRERRGTSLRRAEAQELLFWDSQGPFRLDPT